MMSGRRGLLACWVTADPRANCSEGGVSPKVGALAHFGVLLLSCVCIAAVGVASLLRSAGASDLLLPGGPRLLL